MRRKILPILVISLFFIGLIGVTIAYPSMSEGFLGDSHTGCHGSTSESTTGTLTATASKTSLSAGEKFTVTLSISGFIGATTTERGSECVVVFSSERGDNAEFGSLLADAIREEVDLDTNGDSETLTFTLLAPQDAGSYTLTVDAMSAADHVAESANSILYITTDVSLTVAAAGGIPGYDLIFVFAAAFIVIVPLIIIVRRRRK
jgi:hypothetical protein